MWIWSSFLFLSFVGSSPLPCQSSIENLPWFKKSYSSDRSMLRYQMRYLKDREILLSLIRRIQAEGISLQRQRIQSLSSHQLSKLFQLPDSQPALDPRWNLRGYHIVAAALRVFPSWWEFLREAGFDYVVEGSPAHNLKDLSHGKLGIIVTELYDRGKLLPPAELSKLSHQELKKALVDSPENLKVLTHFLIDGQKIVNRSKRLGFRRWVDFLISLEIYDEKVRGNLPKDVIRKENLDRFLSYIKQHQFQVNDASFTAMSPNDLIDNFQLEGALEEFILQYQISGKNLKFAIRKFYGTWKELSTHFDYDFLLKGEPKTKSFPSLRFQWEMFKEPDGSFRMSRLLGTPIRRPEENLHYSELQDIFGEYLRSDELHQLLEIASSSLEGEDILPTLQRRLPHLSDERWREIVNSLRRDPRLQSYFVR